MSGLSNNCSVLDLKVSSTGASINVRNFPRHTISRIGMRRSYRLAVSSFNKLSHFNGTVVTQQLKKNWRKSTRHYGRICANIFYTLLKVRQSDNLSKVGSQSYHINIACIACSGYFHSTINSNTPYAHSGTCS